MSVFLFTFLFIYCIIKLGDNMKKVKYQDTFVYIDDSKDLIEEDEEIIDKEEELDKTKEIELDDNLFSDTVTDLWGELNDK